MTPESTAVAISGAGFLMSLVGSAFISGVRWGSVKTRLDLFERSMGTMATKEQLSGVKEDVAEIKGMFRLALRDGSGGS